MTRPRAVPLLLLGSLTLSPTLTLAGGKQRPRVKVELPPPKSSYKAWDAATRPKPYGGHAIFANRSWGGMFDLDIAGVPPETLIISVFGKNDSTNKGAIKFAGDVGAAIAKRKYALGHGGGDGLPRLAELAALRVPGAVTVGFTPQKDPAKQMLSHLNDVGTTHLVLVGTGKGLGAIAREAPMAEASHAGIFVNGGSGTFGELVAMLHNGRGVLGLTKGSGGVADLALTKILPYIGANLDDFEVYHESNPETLAAKMDAGVRSLIAKGKLPRTRPTRVINPGAPKDILSVDERSGMVAAFLAEDPRATSTDRAAIRALSQHWANGLGRARLAAGLAPTATSTVTLADHGGMVDELAALAAETQHVVIASPKRGASPSTRGTRSRMVDLGYGDSDQGNFSAQREVVADAKVVFLTSAHLQNLPAVAYALRQSPRPVIAILENASTHGDKLVEMIRGIEGTRSLDKLNVVSSKHPQELVEKVISRLAVVTERKKAADADAKLKARDGRGLD